LLDLKVPPHIVRDIVGHSDIEVHDDHLRSRLAGREAQGAAEAGDALD
jgi:hypothetical protein